MLSTLDPGSPAARRGLSDITIRNLFIIPTIAFLIVFNIFPLIYSLGYSFTDFRASSNAPASFVGLQNYRDLLNDEHVWNNFSVTAKYVLISVGGQVLVGFGVALLLNHPFGRPGLFRVLLIVPWAIAPVANAVLWKWILNANYGILNAILTQLGLIDGYVTWLGTPNRALDMLLIVDIWKSIPFIALLLLAGLQKIPAMLYRAARLDGANTWQQFRFVTLPSLRTTLAIAIILQTLWSFKLFDLIYVLTRGGPADGSLLLNYLAYRETFNFLHIGNGAAVANVVFFASLILAILYIRLLRPGGNKVAA